MESSEYQAESASSSKRKEATPSLRCPAPARSTAIVVLGMHRTGTSLVANLLARLGCELGAELNPAAPDNPKGYWEHRGVVETHDTFLLRIGRTWSDPLVLPDEVFRGDAARAAEERLRAIVDTDFRGCARWAVKDPRMCRLLPLWRQLFDSDGLKPRFLHVVRSPLAVAQSLEARDGLSLEKSLLLWLRHTLEAESFTRGRDRLFIRLDRLEEDAVRETGRLAAWIGGVHARDGDLERLVGSVFDPKLIHHHPETAEEARLLHEFPWPEQVYRAVTQLEGGEAASTLAELDRVRSEVARADRLMVGHPLVWALERRNEQSLKLSHEIAGLGRLVTVQRAEIDAERREIDELHKIVERLVQHMEASEHEARGERRQGEERHRDVTDRVASLMAEIRVDREGAVESNSRLEARLGELQSAMGTAEAIARLESQLGELRSTVATSDEVGRLLDTVTEQAARLEQKHVELLSRSLAMIAEMDEDLALRRDALEKATADLSQLRRDSAAMEGELGRTREHISHVEEEHQRKADAIVGLEGTYRQLEEYARHATKEAAARLECIQELARVRQRLEREHSECRDLLDHVISSRSWRLTEPLRRLRSALGNRRASAALPQQEPGEEG